MGTDLSFNVGRTAVLAMDCQAGLMSIYTQRQEQAFLERALSALRERPSAVMRSGDKTLLAAS
jgi:hypothetical protein